MCCSPSGHKELDMTERLNISVEPCSICNWKGKSLGLIIKVIVLSTGPFSDDDNVLYLCYLIQ